MPYTILGNTQNLGTDPFLHNNKHYVPLREIVQALGGTVHFDNNTKRSHATIGPWSAEIEMGSGDVTVTGNAQSHRVNLTAPAFVDNDEMYVPFDFFRDAYGYDVDLNGDELSIVNPNAA